MGSSESKSLPPALKDLENLDPAGLYEYKKVFENGDMSEFRRKIDEDINRWKNVPVNIAVTGNSGVGKSSFINSFRGLKATSEGAAAVGINETTAVPTEYVHPLNNNLALWDLPGFGTRRFPRSTYLQDVGFEKYDFFLILTATRFTENDTWLAKEVERVGKKFFFVRTKIELDVKNAKYDNHKSCKDETVKLIRNAMAEHVAKEYFINGRVFLIDNQLPLDYDFPSLVETMLDSAPNLKKEAMTLTMTNLTKELIERKKAALRKRIMIVALGSTAAGAVPLPGTSLDVDMAIMKSEITFYRKQLGLDDESLHQVAKSLNKSINELQRTLNISSYMFEKSIPLSGHLIKNAKDILSIDIPIIGNAIAAYISYDSTVSALRSVLDLFVNDAMRINDLLAQRFSQPSRL